jgi:hypothetical protein
MHIRLSHLSTCLGVFWLFGSITQLSALADDKPVANKPAVGQAPAATNGADAKESKATAEVPEFVRTVFDDRKRPVTLQTAIVSYRADSGPFAGAQVDLIGAIHIGDKAYYAELNRRFKNYEALLYEMVADPQAVPQLVKEGKNRSSVSALQSGMKDMLGLTFQLDEIDYTAKNFVHADMEPEEFARSLSDRQEGMLQFVMRSMGAGFAMQGANRTNDLDVLSAMFSSNRELAMKRVFAQQLQAMDGQMAAISGDDGKSTLITERNAKALEVLKRELKAGKKKIGIFYGAGHFKHMHSELESQFSLKPVDTQWLDAWDMR